MPPTETTLVARTHLEPDEIEMAGQLLAGATVAEKMILVNCRHKGTGDLHTLIAILMEGEGQRGIAFAGRLFSPAEDLAYARPDLADNPAPPAEIESTISFPGVEL